MDQTLCVESFPSGIEHIDGLVQDCSISIAKLCTGYSAVFH